MSQLIPFLVLGVALGSVFALSGVGIVVLYRATGVLFLAGGAVGAFGSLCAWSLVSLAGVPVGLAALAAIVVGALVTFGYGLVLGPRLADREPVVKSTATLGLLLALLGTMSTVWGADTYDLSLPSTNWGFPLGNAYLNGTQLVGLTLSLVATGAVGWFLHRTRTGTAMRALAENRQTTAMLGVRVGRLEALAWAGSGLLFGVSGLLLSNMVGLDITGLTFLVVSGLAAALLGRLRSLPVTLAGGVAIGVIQSLLTPLSAVSPYRTLTPFLVAVLVVLVLAGRRPATNRV
jgi:branched-chain amino acid transport system permease protein